MLVVRRREVLRCGALLTRAGYEAVAIGLLDGAAADIDLQATVVDESRHTLVVVASVEHIVGIADGLSEEGGADLVKEDFDFLKSLSLCYWLKLP